MLYVLFAFSAVTPFTTDKPKESRRLEETTTSAAYVRLLCRCSSEAGAGQGALGESCITNTAGVETSVLTPSGIQAGVYPQWGEGGLWGNLHAW